jgi:DNA-binding GntR family transcriptional regulator
VLEQVSARRPDAEEVAVLEIDTQEALLILMRTDIDSAGRPVEYAVSRMVGRLSDPIAYRTRTTHAD